MMMMGLVTVVWSGGSGGGKRPGCGVGDDLTGSDNVEKLQEKCVGTVVSPCCTYTYYIM